MTAKRVGEKFPEEEDVQSMHSPSAVADEETLERKLRRNVEMSETGRPTEAAFPRKQLLGKNGTGLSVNRLSRPEAEGGMVAPRKSGVAYARVVELREIADRQGRRTVSVVDAGTEDNPYHAEIYMRLNGTDAGPMETRARVLIAFGGRQRFRQ